VQEKSQKIVFVTSVYTECVDMGLTKRNSERPTAPIDCWWGNLHKNGHCWCAN